MATIDDYEQLPTTSVATNMTAGAIAGILEHCVMYPLDSVKVCDKLHNAFRSSEFVAPFRMARVPTRTSLDRTSSGVHTRPPGCVWSAVVSRLTSQNGGVPGKFRKTNVGT